MFGWCWVSLDGSWEETAFKSVGVAHNATVPSSGGQQAKQMVTRMKVISKNPLCPGETMGAGNIVEEVKRTPSYFLSSFDDPV